MKTEMRKRNLWERIKLAFRLLFSNDGLLPVYQEGFEDGKSTVYDDYKVCIFTPVKSNIRNHET